MMETATIHRLINTVLLIGAVLLLIWMIRAKSPATTSVTTIDTSKHDVIINNWQPSQTVSGQKPPTIIIEGMDSLAMRAMLIELSMKWKADHEQLTATNTYDSIFKDTTYKETLHMEVTGNRLSMFSRSLVTFNRNTTVTDNNIKRTISGGMFALPTQGVNAEFGAVVTYSDRKGRSFSLGKSFSSSGIYGAVQFQLYKK